MPVKAEFTADFKSFVEGVDKADAKLAQFGKTAEKTAGSSNQFSKAINQADSVLSQAGINIGPTAKALDEMASAAGKSAADLGALATAGLVVGTAMAAWNVGRAIADFLGLDKAIADGTATLLGWGDAIAQVSGAQTDTINAAIRNGAAATISYSEAIKYNTEFHKKRLDTVKEANKADEDTAAAMKELNSVGGTLQGTLDSMNGSVVEAVKHYLELGVSQAALQTAYGLTAVQVKAVAESMKQAEAADKAWLESMKAAAAEAELYASILAGALKNAIDATATADARATSALTTKTDAIVASILAEQEARDSLTQTATSTDTLTSAWDRMHTKLAALESAKVGDIATTARQQVIYNEFTDALLEEARAQDAATQAQHRAPAALDATAAATDRATKSAGVFMNQLHMLVDDPKLAAFFGGDAKGAVATTLYGGGQSGITPEMAAAMAAGQFINTAGVGQPGPTVNNVFNVNGTGADVARQVSAEIMATLKRGGKMASS